MAEKKKGGFPCTYPFCKKVFDTGKALIEHMQKEHRDEPQNPQHN